VCDGLGMKSILGCLLVSGVLMGAELPVKAPADGRLHLVVPGDAPPLRDISMEGGVVQLGNWLEDKEAARRLSDVGFPVNGWRWRDYEIRFTPAADGEIEIFLNGPWAEKSPGTLWRQELLWDDVQVDGVELTNGDFSRGIEGWESPWGPYPEAGAWPLEEAGYGASWHGRPLKRKLPVRGGVEMVLRFKVKAAREPGFIEPRRLGADTPAHRALAKLRRGVNLGNNWEAEPGTWGVGYGTGDIDAIAAAGFDHIRVPVAWHFHWRDGEIDPAFLAELEPVLKRALEKGMAVMLDWHHYEDFVKNPAAHREAFVKGWGTIARHFQSWPGDLWLELLNEPNGPLDGEVLNEAHAAAIREIRKTNPERIIVVNPGAWSTVRMLGDLRLPDDDDRIVVSVHCYDPFEFTHQGASWVGLQDLKGIVFPGPPAEPLELPEALADRPGLRQWLVDYNRLPEARNPSSIRPVEAWLSEAAEWSRVYGRPVHLGEFGAFQTADLNSRSRYARAVREAAEKAGIPWCWWEWKAGFGLIDPQNGKELLIDELMGR